MLPVQIDASRTLSLSLSFEISFHVARIGIFTSFYYYIATFNFSFGEFARHSYFQLTKRYLHADDEKKKMELNLTASFYNIHFVINVIMYVIDYRDGENQNIRDENEDQMKVNKINYIWNYTI